ncbi:hypothetical protein C8J57DRAFT_1591136 [Mycena rebaudengoi]|nr:hypothetical protein C8J57DRAFT_1591136 [Mycena rebaudengoi]
MTRCSGAYSSPLLSSPCSIPTSRPPLRARAAQVYLQIQLSAIFASSARRALSASARRAQKLKRRCRPTNAPGIVAPCALRRGGDGWEVPQRLREKGAYCDASRSPLRLWSSGAWIHTYSALSTHAWSRTSQGAGATRLRHPMAEAQRVKEECRRKHTYAGGDGVAEEGGHCGAGVGGGGGAWSYVGEKGVSVDIGASSLFCRIGP